MTGYITIPKETEIRIDIPQKNLDKFKEVLLYILNKVGANPNIGQTVIYKLLYFIDFNYKSLKGKGVQSGIRVIYAYFEVEDKIVLIEIYYKGDKENEDRDRISRYYKR